MTTSNEHNNATAQERCSTCGYLTSEREHLGCLRRAVKDLDIATGGPYDAQGVGLTDEEIEHVCAGIYLSDHPQGSSSYDIALAHAIISALRAKALGMTVTYQFDAEMEHNNAPAVPQGWTDADSDSARLALELECLLMDTKDLSVVSKWWASANEALELHRQRLAATPAPAPALPEGWVQCTVTYEGQHPEGVAYGPRQMMARLKKWLDCYFELRMAQQHTPGESTLSVEREPDYWSGGHFYEGTKSWINPANVWALPIGTKLYADPTPTPPAPCSGGPYVG